MSYPFASAGVDPKLSKLPATMSDALAPLAVEDAWKLTPATFAHRVSHGEWIPARHLLYVSSAIATAIHRGRGRLLISFPPRYGKSELLSIWTPLWVLSRNPTHRIIVSSYGADLSEDFTKKSRDRAIAAAQEGIDLGFQINREAMQVARWETTAGGIVYALGVGGALTGRGANLLLVDDYFKNAKESESETTRNNIWEWFVTAALTRLEPNGTCIIIATRWHIDDLIGRLRKLSGDVWTHIEMPAVAPPPMKNAEGIIISKPDVLGRKPGEVLWPERYDATAVDEMRKIQGPYFWAALYQQQPVPRSAGILDVEKIVVVNIIPNHSRMRKVRFWDFAATPEGGDYTVGAMMIEDDISGFTYIADIKRGRFSPAQNEQLVRETASQDGTDTTIVIEQEPGSSGKAVVDSYARRILKGYIIRSMRPTGDKFVRAQPFFAAVDNNLVRMKDAGWNSDFIDELRLFPDGPHDDQVDSAAGGFNELNAVRYKGVVWGREGSSYSGVKPSGDLITGITWGRG